MLGGEEPFSAEWSNGQQGKINSGCTGDTLLATVIDGRGCTKSIEVVIPFADNNGELLLYPNPSSDWMAIQFDLEEESDLKALLYNEKGALIKVLLERKGKVGTNELVFSTENLASGNYVFSLLVNGELYKTSNVIKN